MIWKSALIAGAALALATALRSGGRPRIGHASFGSASRCC